MSNKANRLSSNRDDRKRPVLFISDEKFVEFVIPGGVQLCSLEFLEYLSMGESQVHLFTINSTKNIFKRVKVKFGINVYDLYDFEEYVSGILNLIDRHQIKLILLNQINLSPLAILLKDKRPALQFIGLSHGNESGDFIHDITKTKTPNTKEIWKLGKQLVIENYFFSKVLDGVITISEHEKFINEWLGSDHTLYIPRLLKPQFILHNPVINRVGFVGTLEHLPNSMGLELLCNALQDQKFDGEVRIIGGKGLTSARLSKKFNFVTYLGKLTDDALIQEMGSWALFLNPVFWFSRGSSTKLAQAINSGLPTLSTPAGNRGYELENSTFTTISHDEREFASKLIEISGNREKILDNQSAVRENAQSFNSQKWGDLLENFLTKTLVR